MKHLWTDGVDTVVAENEGDADKVWAYFVGEARALCVDDQPWAVIPDDREITIRYEDKPEEKDIPAGGILAANENDDWGFNFKITAPAEAWAKHAGDNIENGFLCSTEY